MYHPSSGMGVSENEKGECPEKADACELNFNFVFGCPVQRGVCKQCLKSEKKKRQLSTKAAKKLCHAPSRPQVYCYRQWCSTANFFALQRIQTFAKHDTLLVANAGELSCNCGAAT